MHLRYLLLLFLLPIFVGNGQSNKVIADRESPTIKKIDRVANKSDSIFSLASEVAKELDILRSKSSKNHTSIRRVQVSKVKRKSKSDTVYLGMTIFQKDSLINELADKIRDTIAPIIIYIDRPVMVRKQKKNTFRNWLRKIF